MTAPAGSTLPSLQLVAASGLTREVAAAVHGRRRVVAVLDDDPTRRGRLVAGVPVDGPISLRTLSRHEAPTVICAGKGVARRAIAARLATEAGTSGTPAPVYATVLADSADLPAPGAIGAGLIGAGSILLAHVVLTADVVIGQHVVVMPAAVLTHDDELADYVTVCAGVRLGGGVRVGAAAYLGAGCLVRENVTIGAGATVGMGAVVLDDVPPGETWAGVPARPIRTRALS